MSCGWFPFRITTPSIDSGNPSECSPLKTEIDDADLIDGVEHSEKFEQDLCQITQKITTLSKLKDTAMLICNVQLKAQNHILIDALLIIANVAGVATPVSTKEGTTSSGSTCHSPASSEGGSFPQELIDNFALNMHRYYVDNALIAISNFLRLNDSTTHDCVLELTKMCRGVTEITPTSRCPIWTNCAISSPRMFGRTWTLGTCRYYTLESARFSQRTL